MKILNFCKVPLLAAAVFSSNLALSQAMDGFVSPAFIFTKQMVTPSGAISPDNNASATTDENVARIRYDFQFGRLQKNVEIDVNYGTGGGYNDIGGVFRVFNHFSFSDASSTGVSVGLGLGGRSSSTGIWATSTTAGASLRKFSELIVAPFSRFIWDSAKGFGFALEGGLEVVPQRYFSDGGSPKSDTQSRIRIFVGGTLMLSSRWLE